MSAGGLTARQRMLRHRLGRHPAEVIRDLVYGMGKTFDEAGAQLDPPVNGSTAWRWLRAWEAQQAQAEKVAV